MIADSCRRTIVALFVLFNLWVVQAFAGEGAERAAADAIPSAHLLQAADLARILQSPAHEKPLILQVGSRVLFAQAHIPGAEYVGAAGQDAGIRALKARAETLDRARDIVIYCGCCPWAKCPNIRRAYAQLAGLGFTHVRALYIGEDFGTDWVAKGYPVAKSEQ